MATQDSDEAIAGYQGFLRGMLGVVSVPAIILMTSFFGFGVLCRESGLSLGQAVLMTASIWALPSQVVLAGSIASGASLFASAIAVTLSAIRLMPMTAAWVPVVRNEGSARWKLLALSHFVAVTAWVWALMRLPSLPRSVRLTYFAGFAMTLSVLNIAITVLSYELAGSMSVLVAGSLFFLTPIYFITALTAAARHLAEKLAMPLGIVLGPLFFHMQIGLDLVWTGLLGGTIAYLADRIARSRP
jgi:predicted branched-subunit amino acid permease